MLSVQNGQLNIHLIFRYFSFTTGSYRLEEPTKKLSIIDPNTAICKQFLVLHGNHDGEMGQKIDLVIIFDWRVLLTYKDQHVWTAFCKIFSGTPHLTIFGAPKYTKYVCRNGLWEIRLNSIFLKSFSSWLSQYVCRFINKYNSPGKHLCCFEVNLPMSYWITFFLV